MTVTPSADAARTSFRKCGLSSGAPPVRSMVSSRGADCISSMSRSTVRSSIISVRLGPASTWQCLQA